MKSIFSIINDFIIKSYPKDGAFSYSLSDGLILSTISIIYKYDYKKFNDLLNLIPNLNVNKINQFISLMNILSFMESKHFEPYIYLDIWEDKLTINIKPCFEIFIGMNDIFVIINGCRYCVDEFEEKYDTIYMDFLNSKISHYPRLLTINDKNVLQFCNLDIESVIQNSFKKNLFADISITDLYKNASKYLSHEYEIVLIKDHGFDAILDILKKSKVNSKGINQLKTLIHFLEILDCFVFNKSIRPFFNNIDYIFNRYKSKLLNSYNVITFESKINSYRLAINTDESLFKLAYIDNEGKSVHLHGYCEIYNFLKTVLIKDISKTLDIDPLYLTFQDLNVYFIVKYK